MLHILMLMGREVVNALKLVIEKIKSCDSNLAQRFENAVIKADLDSIKSITPEIFEKCRDFIEWHEIVRAINYVFPSIRFKDLTQIIGPFIVKDLMAKILRDLRHWLYLCTTDTCIYREIEKAIATICSDFPDMGLSTFLENALRDVLSHSAKFLLHITLENIQRELSLTPIQRRIDDLATLCLKNKCCLETFSNEENLREVITKSITNEIINAIVSIINGYMKQCRNPLELENFINKELMYRLRIISKEANDLILSAINNLRTSIVSYLESNIDNIPIDYNTQPNKFRELLPTLTKSLTDEEIKEILKRGKAKRRKSWFFRFFR